MKALVAACVAVSLGPSAWGGFIIDAAPERTGSWTQQITLSGSFDAVAFQIVSYGAGGGGPWLGGIGDVGGSNGPGAGNGGEGFEIVPDPYTGSFEAPAISQIADPSAGGAPLAAWNVVSQSPTLVTAMGPTASTMAITLHFAGDISEPIMFRGVAFNDGEFQFSADFVWNGMNGLESLGWVGITNVNGWQPDPDALGMVLIPVPLPAAVWMGSVGLLAIVVLRRRLH